MKTTLLSTALFLTGAMAFPADINPEMMAAISKAVLQKRVDVPGFDAKSQLVSVSGVHKFVPPNFAAGDARGPCPGLNALANHGYLPHNGVGTALDFLTGTLEGVGLGADIGGFFGTYGAFSAGDGVQWSIGGPPNGGALSDAFPGFFGTPKGISFSHNEYESDGSAARGDLYQFGNDYELQLPFFEDILNRLPADSLDALSAHRGVRVQQSISQNPYFFQGPFTGIGVAGAANSFVFRLMANKSAEHPGGLLTRSVLKSFYGVTGSGANLVKNPGMERIPENFYKRSLQNQYTFPEAFADLGQYALQHPNTAKVGGNTNGVNTFSGVDVANLTGGVYNSANLLQGNNLGCFAYQSAALLAPDFLSKQFSNVAAAQAALNKVLNGALAPLGCPQLKQLDAAALERFPGYKRSQNEKREAYEAAEVK